MTSACDIAALPADEQYALVYQGICAVAARCDGAVSEDFVGFNGQDTKFGRRIASVPFESWTDDVKVEAARIALTYKQQILSYTGIDVFELPVVKAATGHATNHQARDDARGFERRGSRSISYRDGRVICDFAYDARLKDALKAEGARFNPADKTWWFDRATISQAAVDLIKREFPAGEELVAGSVAPVAAEPNIWFWNDVVVCKTPFALKDELKAAGNGKLRWNGEDKTWRIAAAYPEAAAVVAWAKRKGLVIAEGVETALKGAVAAAGVKLDRKAVLVGASRLSRPQDVSPEFLALVAEAVR